MNVRASARRTQARLLPNTHIDIHVVTRTGRVLVRCRVVRAYVWYLEADLICCRVALAFDRTLDTSSASSIPVAFPAFIPAANSD